MKSNMEARDVEVHERRRAIEDAVSTSNQMSAVTTPSEKNDASKTPISNYGIRDLDVKPDSGSNTAISKEGYLYVVKLQGQGIVQKRAWCVVDVGKLSVHKKKKVCFVVFGQVFRDFSKLVWEDIRFTPLYCKRTSRASSSLLFSDYLTFC